MKKATKKAAAKKAATKKPTRKQAIEEANGPALAAALKAAAAKKPATKKPAAKKQPVEGSNNWTARNWTVPAGKAPRPGTKRYLVLELLNRKGGATRTEIMNATGWDKTFVDGFIGWTVKKTFGLPVVTTKADDGEKTYTVQA
jgi:hypothetical protein